MRFTLEQSLPAPVGDVLSAFTDPAYLESLARLPKLGSPELLDQRQEGAVVHQRVRYRFRGELSPAVRRVVDPDRLTWVDERTYDVAAATASFQIVPDHYGGRLRCSGAETYVAVRDGDERTLRRVDGELTVRWPIVGGAVERAIVAGLQEHLDDEVDVVVSWLDRRPRS